MLKNSLVFLVWLVFTNSIAQTLVDKRISISFSKSDVLTVLQNINSLDGVKLSYNPDAILNREIQSMSYFDTSLEKVLRAVLGEGYDYKYRGSYVIIQRISQESKKSKFEVNGAVTDATTGQKITNVTVYEVNKFQSTLTDDKGKFELMVSAKANYVTLSVSKKNYQDTVIQVNRGMDLTKSLVLTPVKLEERERIRIKKFEIESERLVKFFTTNKARKNTENVTLQEERSFQFSLIPKVGTNGSLSGQVKNNFSVNLLAGYAYGLEGFEIGGLYNINRRETKGLQLAGFGNANGGTTKGAQFAGFINTTKGYTSGLQMAGFFNLVADSVKGVQIGGFLNIANQTRGVQTAGFLNIADQTNGVQLGGFSNIVTERIEGLQMSGFANRAKDLDGAQVAGFINMVNEMDGIQMSGFVNYAKKVKGVQFGILNIADTVESGATIGLFNWVKKGKHQVSLAHSDFMDASLAFRMGTDKFYSKLTAGSQFSSEKIWSAGMGFGTQFQLKNKLYANIDLTAHYIKKPGRNEGDETNLLNRLNLNFGYQLAKHFSINAGPALNIYVTNVIDEANEKYGDDFGQSTFYDRTSGNTNVSMWIGYAVSVRF